MLPVFASHKVARKSSLLCPCRPRSSSQQSESFSSIGEHLLISGGNFCLESLLLCTWGHFWPVHRLTWTRFIGFSFFQSNSSMQGIQNTIFSIFMLASILNPLVQQVSSTNDVAAYLLHADIVQIMPRFVSQRSLYEVRHHTTAMVLKLIQSRFGSDHRKFTPGSLSSSRISLLRRLIKSFSAS
jgi:hypothetical protein